MKLTKKEKKEIFECLEKNKTLPKNYRFKLFDDKNQVELLWLDKSTEISQVVMPFQSIEHIDEPRKETTTEGIFGDAGRQQKGWTNKLIWGDNKFILSSLKNGPMFEEIKKQGGIKLIYIDPPFDVGADFSMKIEVGNESYEKKAGVLEEPAYRDTWGKGMDSFIAMIYERLKLMRELLAEDGSIYVHCDWRVNSYIRLIMDEIFGKDNFRNEIIWHYRRWTSGSGSFQNMHDYILYYSRSQNTKLNKISVEPTESKKKAIERGYHTNVVGSKNKKITQLLVYDNEKFEDLIKNLIKIDMIKSFI